MKLRIFTIASTACLAVLAVMALPATASAGVLTITPVTATSWTITAPAGWKISSDIGCYPAFGTTTKGYTAVIYAEGEGSSVTATWTPIVNAGTVASFDIECDLEQSKRVKGWRTYKKMRIGWNYSSQHSSDSCHFEDGWDGWSSLWIDCWGGSATVKYRFSPLPLWARHVSRRVVGHQRALYSGCCLSSRWSGNTATIKVSGYRGYEVTRVVITYKRSVWTTKTYYGDGVGSWTAS